MSITAGVLTSSAVSSNTDTITSTPPTAGTGPYTQQLYRSTTTGFAPGSGNIVTGATGLTFNDSGLIPNTPYFYKMVYTDTGAGGAQVTSAQLAVTTTQQALDPNSFDGAEQPLLGRVDQMLNFNTISVVIDQAQATPLFPGSLVKTTTTTTNIPSVQGIAADTDPVYGVLNFDGLHQSFNAGDRASMSQKGNVIYLYFTTQCNRGLRVVPDITSPGAVQVAAGNAQTVVGTAFDQVSGYGLLKRVELSTPDFTTA